MKKNLTIYSPSPDEIKIIKYQWESLRKNKDYVKDYNRFQKINRNPKTNYDKTWFKLEYFFYKKYGIPPTNPDIPFPSKCPTFSPCESIDPDDPLKQTESDIEVAQRTLWLAFIGISKAVRCLSPAIENGIKALQNQSSLPNPIQLDISDEELQKRVSLVFSINIDAPMERIIKELKPLIKNFHQRKKKLTQKNRSRPRPQDYESYFKTYRLAEKGLTITQIAKKRYLHKFKKNPNYARQQVSRDLQRWAKIGCLLKVNPLINSSVIYYFGINSTGILSRKEYYEYFKLRYRNQQKSLAKVGN